MVSGSKLNVVLLCQHVQMAAMEADLANLHAKLRKLEGVNAV
jgi:hypothetical protein